MQNVRTFQILGEKTVKQDVRKHDDAEMHTSSLKNFTIFSSPFTMFPVFLIRENYAINAKNH